MLLTAPNPLLLTSWCTYEHWRQLNYSLQSSWSFCWWNRPFRVLWSAEMGSERPNSGQNKVVDHIKCRVQFLLLVWWPPPLLMQVLRMLIFQEIAERMEEKSVSSRYIGLGGCLRKDPTALLHDCPVSFLPSPPCYQSLNGKWVCGHCATQVCVSVQWGWLDLCKVRWQEFWRLLWHLC